MFTTAQQDRLADLRETVDELRDALRSIDRANGILANHSNTVGPRGLLASSRGYAQEALESTTKLYTGLLQASLNDLDHEK